MTELPIANRPTSDGKTGSWRTRTPVVTDKCIGCGVCVGFCPDGCIMLVGSPRKAKIDYDFCKGCLICAAECPVKAIIVNEKKEERK